MSAFPVAPVLGLLFCGVLLASPPAWGQTTNTPPGGALQLPAKQKPMPAPPTPPKAAPREPVHQAAGSKAPPVVQPHGTTHAQKPHTAPPPPAKSAAVATPPPAAPPPAPTEPPKLAEPSDKGSATSLPLPRFASLRSDEVNLRAGPGTRYPIDWVYKRRDLPVEIDREFEVWRLVKDPDGIKGWVHQATLTGRRGFIVLGADATLRRDASDTATPVAILKPGVIGRIRSCDAGAAWCQVQAGEYRGFLRRNQFWGTLPGEAVSN